MVYGSVTPKCLLPGGIFEVRGNFCRLGSFCCPFPGRHLPSMGLTTRDLISHFLFLLCGIWVYRKNEVFFCLQFINRTSLFFFLYLKCKHRFFCDAVIGALNTYIPGETTQVLLIICSEFSHKEGYSMLEEYLLAG